VKYLEGLPTQKIHCSVMGAEALEAAVFNWAGRRGVDLRKLGIDIEPHEQAEGRVVCKCFSITEPYLRRKIKELNLKTISDITSAIKAGGACSSCHHAPGGLQDILNEEWGTQASPAPATPRADAGKPVAAETPGVLSPFQFFKKVESVLKEYVRPMLQRDGGDLELVDIKEQTVYCRLEGACAGCVGASMTLKMMVEQTLKDRVDERIRVISV
jgi:NifU-like protein